MLLQTLILEYCGALHIKSPHRKIQSAFGPLALATTHVRPDVQDTLYKGATVGLSDLLGNPPTQFLPMVR